MALDECVQHNPTQPVYFLEIEGGFLLFSGKTQIHTCSHQMCWEVNAYTQFTCPVHFTAVEWIVRAVC